MAGQEQSFALPPELFRLKLTGLELLSLGETDLEDTLAGKDGYESHLLTCDEQAGQYHKIVTRSGKVFGAILLGPCPFSRLVEKAVQERRDWSALQNEIKATIERK
ncbi:MAG TPA: hypothetical protein PKO06_10660, partial [Candidatus Ozemobacteraceae bacterium]|nr:hypothetical protein [Candidatus Ozemobacteraceae bacterium]